MTTSPLRTAPSTAACGALPDAAVDLRGLTKIYRGKRGDLTALEHIDLVIPRGSIFGLLGPNGAGKSTLINILAGLVIKTAGEVRIWGIDLDAEPRQSRAAIGVVPQEIAIDFFFTPRELLETQAGFYGVPKHERRTSAILAALGLADKADAPARTLSGGMRRRLLVGKAMVNAPPVLVLDEPTAGVDVELRKQLWLLVRELRERGTTILLTTHYLDEAQQLCDRIAIIHHGRVVAHGVTEELLREVDDKSMSLTLMEKVTEIPPGLAALGLVLAEPGRLTLRYRPSRTQVATVFAAIAAHGLTIRDVTSEETDLEDLFLQLTSRVG